MAGTLIFIGSLFCLFNWSMIYQSWWTKKHHSVVPFVGAIPLGLGLWLLEPTRPYTILAILADPGTILGLIGLPRLAQELWPICRFNRLEILIGKTERAEYVLELFRKHVFWIDLKYRRPSDWNGKTPVLSGSALRGNWKKAGNVILLSGYSGQRQAILEKQSDGRYIAREMGLLADEKLPYNTLEGVIFEEKLL